MVLSNITVLKRKLKAVEGKQLKNTYFFGISSAEYTGETFIRFLQVRRGDGGKKEREL